MAILSTIFILDQPHTQALGQGHPWIWLLYQQLLLYLREGSTAVLLWLAHAAYTLRRIANFCLMLPGLLLRFPGHWS